MRTSGHFVHFAREFEFLTASLATMGDDGGSWGTVATVASRGDRCKSRVPPQREEVCWVEVGCV